MDDRQIIELYFSRDERAISETDGKYGKYCFCVANNILSNEQDSEECVNDTYVKAWNAIPPQNPNSLKLFLARIVRNLAFDKVKSQTRQKRGGGELMLALDEISEIISDDSCVEEELESKALMQTVNEFLRTVSERECNVFVRRYFFLDSIDAISERYRISAVNTSKILSRTREKLREYLKKEGYSI
jgi:RNA polymerase sigma-70 factor (ECF subfamily)